MRHSKVGEDKVAQQEKRHSQSTCHVMPGFKDLRHQKNHKSLDKLPKVITAFSRKMPFKPSQDKIGHAQRGCDNPVLHFWCPRGFRQSKKGNLHEFSSSLNPNPWEPPDISNLIHSWMNTELIRYAIWQSHRHWVDKPVVPFTLEPITSTPFRLKVSKSLTLTPELFNSWIYSFWNLSGLQF